MATEYWPFLVAANKQLDYRVVLCPNFIEKSGRSHMLRTNVGQVEDGDYEGKLQFLQTRDEHLGPFGIFFRETAAQVNDELAHDVAGRRIRRIAGVVIKGVVNRQQFKSAEAEKLLVETEDEFQTYFENFWNAGKSADVKTSAVRIIGEGAPRPIAIPNPDAPQKRTSGANSGSPVASPVSENRKIKAPAKPESKETTGNRTRNVVYALFALSLAFCAASTYEYLSLKRQIKDIVSKMSDPAKQQTELSLLKSRIEGIEARLLSTAASQNPNELR